MIVICRFIAISDQDHVRAVLYNHFKDALALLPELVTLSPRLKMFTSSVLCIFMMCVSLNSFVLNLITS